MLEPNDNPFWDNLLIVDLVFKQLVQVLSEKQEEFVELGVNQFLPKPMPKFKIPCYRLKQNHSQSQPTDKG